MPQTRVLFYRDSSVSVPVLGWLLLLRRRDRRGYAKCLAKIQRLSELGHELRRPEADYLRDGIHELRARQGHVNYRILYFFSGRDEAVLVHALTKEGAVDDSDIERAVRRKNEYQEDPKAHGYEGEA